MLLFRAGFCRERIRLPDSNSRIPFGMNQRRGCARAYSSAGVDENSTGVEICKANSSGVEPRFRGLQSILLRIRHNTCQRYAVLGGP